MLKQLKKILIIEDDVVIANHIKLALEENGHQIIGIARSHAEVNLALEKQIPELILIEEISKGITVCKKRDAWA